MSVPVIKPNYKYHVSRLQLMRGKQVVVANIPAYLRPLYGSVRSKRISTGTSDFTLAQARRHDIAQEIYDEFDAKQNEHQTKHHVATDNFAAKTIIGLVTEFNYKNIPDLKSSTDYEKLVNLKNSCDVYAE
mgnify:CR=1 FL=1